MGVVAHHVLLALSVAGLLSTGVRAASPACERGLLRVVAAVVLAATLAGLEALGLGLVRLGTDPVALGLATAATWGLALVALPAPAVPVGAEAAAAWRAAPRPARLALGAVLGVGLAWSAWLLRHPGLGIDSVAYHLPEIFGWIRDGSPGAIEPVFPDLPIGNYPLTNEVLLAWSSGLARSFVPASLWAPALMLLLGTAAWGGLRALGVERPPAAVAVAALCLAPTLTHYQMNGANTDLPAVTWLVCAGFLALGSSHSPGLLPFALLAAALSVGTKTTTLPLCALMVGWAAVHNRGELRRMGVPLALATVASVGVGGYWYLRNLVDHASPFWPLVRSRWSDDPPSTAGIEQGLDVSFLDHPIRTIDRIGGDWADLFGGGLLLLAAALLVPFLARSRRVTVAAVVTAASVLIWMNAPFTGVSVDDFEVATISTVRYLLPGMVAALVTLALATTGRSSARRAALLALAAGAILNLLQTADLGFPSVPPWGTVLAGGVAGALAAALLDPVAARVPDLPRPARLVMPALAFVLAGALLAAAAPGYVGRHGATASLFGSDMVRWFATQPAFADGDAPMAGAPILYGPLAGNRLQHPFHWIDDSESCAGVRARARAGWVVVTVSPATGRPSARSARCLASMRPAFSGAGVIVYGGAR